MSFYDACLDGNLDLVQSMIDRGAIDWDRGLQGACKGGHMELAQQMIARGATDWNGGLQCACRGGHLEIAQLMIDRGATNWDWGLHGACRGGHMELVELMILRGADFTELWKKIEYLEYLGNKLVKQRLERLDDRKNLDILGNQYPPDLKLMMFQYL